MKTIGKDKTRREKADDVLLVTGEYLADAGWLTCNETVQSIDPITGTKYPGDVAYCIQLGRDLDA